MSDNSVALDVRSLQALSYPIGEWSSMVVGDTQLEDEAIEKINGTKAQVSTELGRLLSAENLVILSGLGTSLDIPASAPDAKAPTMTDLWDSVVKLPSFSALSSDINPQILEEKNFEHLLSEIQIRLSISPEISKLRDFLAEAEEIVLSKCSFINENSDVETHQLFLRKVARRSTRLQRTQLFTTNYDCAFEMAAKRAHFNLVDGFGLGGVGFFDPNSFEVDLVRRTEGERLTLEPNVLQFLKLHGSVDWNRKDDSVQRIFGRPDSPVLIYPSQRKFQLSYQQPYLEVMARFQMALRKPDVGLLITGFGFNDAHIVAPIEAALRSNSGLRVVVSDPAINRTNNNQSFSLLEKLTRAGDRRILLINGTFAEITSLLPEVPLRDEREVHASRFTRSDSRE